jgi:hypothetical protein
VPGVLKILIVHGWFQECLNELGTEEVVYWKVQILKSKFLNVDNLCGRVVIYLMLVGVTV